MTDRTRRQSLAALAKSRGLRFIFAWYDLWVGAYWDRANRRLYILPLPMCGIVITFPRTR